PPPHRPTAGPQPTPHQSPVRRPRSSALEHAAPLVVGDDFVEQALLGATVVEIVAPDLLAERGAGEVAALPQLDRLSQARGERFGAPCLIRVAAELGAGLGAVCD